MRPTKEKAIELFKKFEEFTKYDAKKCALILAKEMLAEHMKLKKDLSMEGMFWEQVIREIETTTYS